MTHEVLTGPPAGMAFYCKQSKNEKKSKGGEAFFYNSHCRCATATSNKLAYYRQQSQGCKKQWPFSETQWYVFQRDDDL